MKGAAASDPPVGAANVGKGFQRSGKSQGNLLCAKLIGRILSGQLGEMVTHVSFSEVENMWSDCQISQPLL